MRLAAAWKLRLQRVMMNEVEADLSILLSMSFCTIGKTYTDVDAMMEDLLRRSSESSMNKPRKIYGV